MFRRVSLPLHFGENGFLEHVATMIIPKNLDYAYETQVNKLQRFSSSKLSALCRPFLSLGISLYIRTLFT